MKVLVTGGAGFIGSHISEALCQEGATVAILDNFSTGRRENIGPFEKKIRVFEGDLRDPGDVERAVQGMDAIVHTGALPSVPKSFEQPALTNSVNVGGTIHLLEAARRANVTRLVYSASSSAYGNLDTEVKSENLPPAPASPYALQKLSGEYYAKYYFENYKLPTVSLRYFNVFGPRQDPNSPYSAVIPLFIRAALKNESPTIYGDGKQTRDFTYVSNIVHANLLALRAPEKALGQVMNTACGTSFSLLELWSLIKDITGTTATPTFSPARVGDVKHSLASNKLAESLIGYRPQAGFLDGLKLTVEYFRKAI